MGWARGGPSLQGRHQGEGKDPFLHSELYPNLPQESGLQAGTCCSD
jgi:hypothetical protein